MVIYEGGGGEYTPPKKRNPESPVNVIESDKQWTALIQPAPLRNPESPVNYQRADEEWRRAEAEEAARNEAEKQKQKQRQAILEHQAVAQERREAQKTATSVSNARPVESINPLLSGVYGTPYLKQVIRSPNANIGVRSTPARIGGPDLDGIMNRILPRAQAQEIQLPGGYGIAGSEYSQGMAQREGPAFLDTRQRADGRWEGLNSVTGKWEPLSRLGTSEQSIDAISGAPSEQPLIRNPESPVNYLRADEDWNRNIQTWLFEGIGEDYTTGEPMRIAMVAPGTEYEVVGSLSAGDIVAKTPTGRRVSIGDYNPRTGRFEITDYRNYYSPEWLAANYGLSPENLAEFVSGRRPLGKTGSLGEYAYFTPTDVAAVRALQLSAIASNILQQGVAISEQTREQQQQASTPTPTSRPIAAGGMIAPLSAVALQNALGGAWDWYWNKSGLSPVSPSYRKTITPEEGIKIVGPGQGDPYLFGLGRYNYRISPEYRAQTTDWLFRVVPGASSELIGIRGISLFGDVIPRIPVLGRGAAIVGDAARPATETLGRVGEEIAGTSLGKFMVASPGKLTESSLSDIRTFMLEKTPTMTTMKVYGGFYDTVPKPRVRGPQTIQVLEPAETIGPVRTIDLSKAGVGDVKILDEYGVPDIIKATKKPYPTAASWEYLSEQPAMAKPARSSRTVVNPWEFDPEYTIESRLKTATEQRSMVVPIIDSILRQDAASIQRTALATRLATGLESLLRTGQLEKTMTQEKERQLTVMAWPFKTTPAQRYTPQPIKTPTPIPEPDIITDVIITDVIQPPPEKPKPKPTPPVIIPGIPYYKPPPPEPKPKPTPPVSFINMPDIIPDHPYYEQPREPKRRKPRPFGDLDAGGGTMEALRGGYRSRTHRNPLATAEEMLDLMGFGGR